MATYYVGLDVHSRQSTFVVEDAAGKVVAQGEVPTTPAGFSGLVATHGLAPRTQGSHSLRWWSRRLSGCSGRRTRDRRSGGIARLSGLQLPRAHSDKSAVHGDYAQLVEVTPESIRVRKRVLAQVHRPKRRKED